MADFLIIDKHNNIARLTKEEFSTLVGTVPQFAMIQKHTESYESSSKALAEVKKFYNEK